MFYTFIESGMQIFFKWKINKQSMKKVSKILFTTEDDILNLQIYLKFID